MSCDRRLGGNGGQISIKMEGNMEDLELLIGKSSSYGKTCIKMGRESVSQLRFFG
jgi:hypothetical protein